MEEKCLYRHLPFMERKGPPGWNGSVRWNGKAEGKARVESEGTSEDVIMHVSDKVEKRRGEREG